MKKIILRESHIMITSNIISLYFIISLHIFSVRATCKVNTTAEISKFSPLLLKGNHFTYPSRQCNDIITFCNNQTQELYCSGSSFDVLGSKIQDSHLSLTCKNEMTFTNEKISSDFKNIRCSKAPISTTRKVGICPNGQLMEIGFPLTEEKFASTINLCFDNEAGKTTWAHTLIPGSIRGRNHSKRPRFRAGGNWANISIAEAYKIKSQVQQFMKIFANNQSLVDRYIKNKGNYFLSRGHLVAKTDKFYSIEQESTFYYINALPMWQIINSGNWAIVEETIRTLASDNGDVHVWVGGLYNLSLPDASNENKLIYLANHHATKSPVIIVPKFLFKIVYHEPTNRAMVYVTINNPYLLFSELPDEYRICKVYSGCRKGSKCFQNNKLGYTYCCLYDDFMKDTIAFNIGLPILHRTSPFV